MSGDGWLAVQQRIHRACARAGRRPDCVQVLVATKYCDIPQLDALSSLGINHFGENRVQAALPKLRAFPGACWHFIGSLQRRKARQIVGRFAYLHSLDRISLAQELDKRLEIAQCTLRCFIQVNVARESSKAGILSEELEDFAVELLNFKHLEIVGLMTIAPKVQDAEEVRPLFAQLRALQAGLQELGHPRLQVPHLSMGMSQDFEVAIEEGATWLRLGTVVVRQLGITQD